MRQREAEIYEQLREAEIIKQKVVDDNLRFHSYAEKCLNEWKDNVT